MRTQQPGPIKGKTVFQRCWVGGGGKKAWGKVEVGQRNHKAPRSHTLMRT